MKVHPTTAAILLGILFCARYLGFDSALFNGDEAALQLAARQALESGELPWLGLAGTAGMRYGPTGIWFYAFLRWISSSLEFAFFVHATLHGLGFLLQGIAFQRVLQRKFLLPFLAFAWSAPLFWISSRNIWDNSLQVFLFGVLGVLLFPGSSEPHPSVLAARAALSGLVAGLLVNLHLMTVPVIAAMVFWAWKQRQLRNQGLLFLSVMALLLVFPYLSAALHAPRPSAGDPKPWLHFFHRAAIFPFLLPGLILPGKAAYFFDQPWETWAGPLARVWSDFGLSGVLQLAGVGLGFYGLLRLPKGVRGFVLLSAGAYCGFVSILRLNIQIHPHYWNPVFGISILLWALGWTELFHARKKLALALLLGMVGLNLSAIAKIESIVRGENGFRSARWGASVGELRKTAAQYCASAELKSSYSPRRFALDPRLGFDPSLALEFMISETKDCRALGAQAPLPVRLQSPEALFSAALALPTGANSK